MTIEQIERVAKNLIDAQIEANDLGFVVGNIQAQLMKKEMFDIIPSEIAKTAHTKEYNHYHKLYNGIDYVWLEAIINE